MEPIPGRQPCNGALQVIHTMLHLRQRTIGFFAGAVPQRIDTLSCPESIRFASSRIIQNVPTKNGAPWLQTLPISHGGPWKGSEVCYAGIMIEE